MKVMRITLRIYKATVYFTWPFMATVSISFIVLFLILSLR